MGLAGKLALGVLALVVLAVAGLIAVLLTAGDEFYRDRAERLLARTVDREVRIGGDFSLAISLEPGLVVTDVTVANAPWAEGPALAHLDRAELQVALLPLLKGVVHLRRLVLDGLTLDLETAADGRHNWDILKSERADQSATGDVFYPIIEQISAKDLSLSYKNDRTGWSSRLVLDELTKSESNADGAFDIRGRGRVNENRYDITGTFGPLKTALQATQPYPLDLAIALPELVVRLAGTVQNLPHAAGFDLKLDLSSPSLGKLLQVWNLAPVADGRLEASAQVSGRLDALAMSGIEAELNDGSNQEIKVSGAFEDLVRGTGLALDLDGHLGAGAQLLQALPETLHDLDGISLTGKLTGGYRRLLLDNLAAELSHPSGAGLSLSGHLALGPGGGGPLLQDLAVAARLSLPDRTLAERFTDWKLPNLKSLVATGGFALDDDLLQLKSMKASFGGYGGLELEGHGDIASLAPKGLALTFAPRLDLKASAQNGKPLLDLIDSDLPDMSPLSATGRLSRSDGRYRLDDLQFTLGKEDRVWLRFAGALDGLPLDGTGALDFKGTAEFAWPSSKTLADYLGHALPELGAAKGQLVLAGWADSLLVSEAQAVSRTADGLTSRANGKGGKVQFEPSFAVQGLDLKLEAEAATTDAVGALPGQHLPDLGPVRAAGRLTGGSKDLALSGITASAGPESAPWLRSSGEVKNLIDGQGMTFDGSFSLPTVELLKAIGSGDIKPKGNLDGGFRLSDAGGSFGIENLSARITETGVLSLTLKGKLDDLQGLDGLNLTANVDVPEPELLGHLFGVDGLDLAPLTYEGRVSGSDESFKMAGRTQVGQTVLTGKMEGGFVGARPHLQAQLSTPVFHFSDFGLTPEDGQTDPPTPPASTTVPSSPAKKLFGEKPLPFDLLRAFDLTLDVRLDKLEGSSLEIDSIVTRAVLADGLLTVDPLSVHIVGSSVKMRLVADAREAEPAVSYSATVDDLNLRTLLGQLDAAAPVEGHLDMIVDVKGRGSSPHGLASTLDGSIDLALRHGKIHSRALAFSALDLSSWLFAKSTRKGYSRLHCFILRLDVDQGLAKSETLYLDSDSVRVVGTGDIDLSKETLDFRMKPHPKTARLAELTTPFTITGTLADPQVNVGAGSTAMRTVGEIVFTPVNLLGNLLTLVERGGKDKDNPCLPGRS